MMYEQRSRFSFATLLTLVCMAGGGYFYYGLRQDQQQMRAMLAQRAAYEADLQKHIAVQEAEPERVVVKGDAWRNIQDNVKNTVVQVFAQISEIDILQPYKAPHQYGACGSAFFINEQGDMITNAHVVNQALSIWVQIPCLGKRILDVELVGVSERDIALLRLKPEGLALVRKELGSIPCLSLGNSDSIRRADEAMALGYPLGQQSLKSTTGVISGKEQGMVQMSAAINPGSSGGPLLNTKGEVIGINTSGIMEANNVGYALPINDLKVVLSDLYTNKLLRKPFLGVYYNNGTEALTEYLGNPQPGGCYVVDVVKNSALAKAGVQRADMIYEINGHKLDIFGDMNVPWSEDKMSLIEYTARLAKGQDIHLVIYRNGHRKDIQLTLNQSELPAIRKMYPGFEEIDYEIFAGMVVMPLSLNHIQALMNVAPGLTRYAETKSQGEQALVVTHMFPGSQIQRSRAMLVGSVLHEVNGVSVSTLDELRSVLKKTADNPFLTLKAVDNVTRSTDNLFVVLTSDKVLSEERMLARDCRFPITPAMQAALADYDQKKGTIKKSSITA